MTVPRDVVFERVIRSVQEFRRVVHRVGIPVGPVPAGRVVFQGIRSEGSSGATAQAAGDAALVIVKPIFFLAVFLDSLTYSFLPKFMQEAAVAAGMSVGYASMPFTAYYLAFALTLIPAGNFAERHGPKPRHADRLLLAGEQRAAMFVPARYQRAMTDVRGLAGIGQGMLMIGVQSYILAVASPEKKTQGAAIIVFGFQGGMIAGMALGSLLVESGPGTQGVFMIAGRRRSRRFLYTLLLLPLRRSEAAGRRRLESAVRKL